MQLVTDGLKSIQLDSLGSQAPLASFIRRLKSWTREPALKRGAEVALRDAHEILEVDVPNSSILKVLEQDKRGMRCRRKTEATEDLCNLIVMLKMIETGREDLTKRAGCAINRQDGGIRIVGGEFTDVLLLIKKGPKSFHQV